MERKKFNQSLCPIARSMDILGDWWNPLILRECMYGNTRFDNMQRWLGISRNILTLRLSSLVDDGYLQKLVYQESPRRYEYSLTEKGYEACTILLAIMPFGDRWYFKAGRQPIELVDKKSGKPVKPMIVDANTGKSLNARNVVARPGPGFKAPKAVKLERFREFYENA